MGENGSKIYSISIPWIPSCEEGILNPLPSPLPLQKGEGCNSFAIKGIFSNHPVPLSKEGSTSHPSPLSSEERDVTAPPVALNRCALRLAGHQRPRQVVVRDGTAGRRLVKTMVVRDGTAGTR